MPEKKKNVKKFIPDFDSSSAMLFALGNFLSGSEEGLGLPSRLPKMLGDMVNITPEALRETIYKLSGAQESLTLRQVRQISDEHISRWITASYPEKKFPAVVVGSSNGALTHICAALGIPWIPQTVLLAVSRRMDPDELVKDAQWGKKAAAILRERVPDMAAYQMHDPVQDRIMVANMGYFRMKRLRLGRVLEEYLDRALVPGGTVFISDCRFQWPAAEMGENHYFQTGGLGDVSGDEYAQGSPRIKSFLKKENSQHVKWDPPRPLKQRPEAEWGYDDRLTRDILKYARRRKLNVQRISFDRPDAVSPLTADLTRDWYRQNGIRDKRLLIECFALIEPRWAAKTGSIPFWMPFNTASSYEAAGSYLKTSGRFDEIYLMIMSNAVEGIGCKSIGQWKKLIKKARKRGCLIGVDEEKFPHDLGSFIKYHKDLQKKITARHFLPVRMGLDDFKAFFRKHRGKYQVKLSTEHKK